MKAATSVDGKIKNYLRASTILILLLIVRYGGFY